MRLCLREAALWRACHLYRAGYRTCTAGKRVAYPSLAFSQQALAGYGLNFWLTKNDTLPFGGARHSHASLHDRPSLLRAVGFISADRGSGVCAGRVGIWARAATGFRCFPAASLPAAGRGPCQTLRTLLLLKALDSCGGLQQT